MVEEHPWTQIPEADSSTASLLFCHCVWGNCLTVCTRNCCPANIHTYHLSVCSTWSLGEHQSTSVPSAFPLHWLWCLVYWFTVSQLYQLIFLSGHAQGQGDCKVCWWTKNSLKIGMVWEVPSQHHMTTHALKVVLSCDIHHRDWNRMYNQLGQNLKPRAFDLTILSSTETIRSGWYNSTHFFLMELWKVWTSTSGLSALLDSPSLVVIRKEALIDSNLFLVVKSMRRTWNSNDKSRNLF